MKPNQKKANSKKKYAISAWMDVGVEDKCYATLWSYGQVCVECKCCSKNKKVRIKARLKYWKWWLKESEDFSEFSDDIDTRKIQERNRILNIKDATKKIKYYSK